MPLSGSGSGSGTETVKRPSAVQDVNFAVKRDAQRGWRGEVSRARERRREGSWKKREEREWGMSVVGWLVIDAGDKEAVARVKFRAGSGPVSFSSSAIASACHRCSRSECNKMLPIVFRRSVVFYCLCCCLCCSLFSLLFRLFCFLFLLCLLPTLLRVRARRADCGSRPSIS